MAQILGADGWDVVNALADIRDGFDPRDWLAGNTEWLARAVREGEQMFARSWAAAATRVSVHLARVPTEARWPELQVPDLGALLPAILDTVTADRRSRLVRAPNRWHNSSARTCEPRSIPATAVAERLSADVRDAG